MRLLLFFCAERDSHFPGDLSLLHSFDGLLACVSSMNEVTLISVCLLSLRANLA